MCRSNFRVKLDLRHYFKDVRRFCWTFIEGPKMLQISHLKKHITRTFNIEEPFHLLLNDTEYLPATEDIRILKEDETILVSPGSGLQSRIQYPENTILPNLNEVAVKNSSQSTTVQKNVQDMPSQKKIQDVPVQKIQQHTSVKKKLPGTLDVLKESLSKSMNDSLETSMCEVTEDEGNISASKSKNTSLMGDVSAAERSKRKRVRSRKKNKTQGTKEAVGVEENISRKPKIVNSLLVSSGKHIHFEPVDFDEDTVTKPIQSKTVNGTYDKTNPPKELANLLSLGQMSEPVTFARSEIQEEIKIENSSDEELRLNMSLEIIKTGIPITKQLQDGNELPEEDLEACPVMSTKPQLKDVIAFKMLKIGTDYTPQVSKFIVGEVISCCGEGRIYTFRILQGASEVQEPIGKFTVETNAEDQKKNSTITLDISQLLEPRHICKCDPDRVSTPINVTD
ncbi:uncharacterized protein LOC143178079 isoform X2 [Calliopsis andreniformis]|uniref:uncharacterized protein LOC143178079 isoform X2 n=1 Tax=Calliopsis andreniformis TaxID=337506 RepID=UPI003FCCF6C9